MNFQIKHKNKIFLVLFLIKFFFFARKGGGLACTKNKKKKKIENILQPGVITI